MFRCQHKYKIKNEDNISPLKFSNPTTVVTECCNIAETQEGPLNNPCGYDQGPKEEISKLLKEIYESTNQQWKERNKMVQCLKVEIKNTQMEGNQKIKKKLGTQTGTLRSKFH